MKVLEKNVNLREVHLVINEMRPGYVYELQALASEIAKTKRFCIQRLTTHLTVYLNKLGPLEFYEYQNVSPLSTSN